MNNAMSYNNQLKVCRGDDFQLVLELEARLGSIRGLAGVVRDAASSDCLEQENAHIAMSILTDIVDESVNLISGWHDAKTFERFMCEGRLKRVTAIDGETMYKIKDMDSWLLVLKDNRVIRFNQEESDEWLKEHQQSAA